MSIVGCKSLYQQTCVTYLNFQTDSCDPVSLLQLHQMFLEQWYAHQPLTWGCSFASFLSKLIFLNCWLWYKESVLDPLELLESSNLPLILVPINSQQERIARFMQCYFADFLFLTLLYNQWCYHLKEKACMSINAQDKWSVRKIISHSLLDKWCVGQTMCMTNKGVGQMICRTNKV